MDPGPLGTLGVGTGFAMASKLAQPHRDVVTLFGDCSFTLRLRFLIRSPQTALCRVIGTTHRGTRSGWPGAQYPGGGDIGNVVGM